MQFLIALTALLKAIPYLDKWGEALSRWIDELRAKRLAKDLDEAIAKAKQDKDTSDLEKILRGD